MIHIAQWLKGKSYILAHEGCLACLLGPGIQVDEVMSIWNIANLMVEGKASIVNQMPAIRAFTLQRDLAFILVMFYYTKEVLWP